MTAMKHILRLLGAATAIIMSTNIPTSAQTRDSEDHRLPKLWEAYGKAADADKPKDELAALEAIKSEAAAKGYAWDWYDAGQKIVSTTASINWKQRAEAESAFNSEIQYAEPIVRYFHGRNSSKQALLQLASDNREKLLESHNYEFYSRDWNITGPVFGPVLPGLITNDYDYILWSLGGSSDEAYALLKERTDGKYPEEALASFRHITGYDSETRTAELEAYAKKWSGKAAVLLAREELLSERFNALREKQGSTGAQYLALKKDCDAFVSDRKAFTGSEKALAECCTGPDSIIETLTAKDISIQVESGVATVALQNLKSAEFKVKDGKKTVFEKSLTNKTATFFVPDTLTFDLPALDDGEYTVTAKSGDTSTEAEYRKYTLSIAMKHDAKAYATYVADYITGDPVGKYKVAVYNDNDTSIGSAVEISGEGFIYLPEEIAGKIDAKGGRNYIQASYTGSDGRLRLSQKQRLSSYYAPRSSSNDASHISATVFTDRAAFNPEETVYYKTIIRRGTLSYEVLAGRKLKATLVDPQGKSVDSQDLTTGEFGSASGSFFLKKGGRNGIYRIRISDSDKTVATASIRVDEFVLPTFNLTWDSDERFYLPGEKMSASGAIRSYSGHSLASAKVNYTVKDGDGNVLKDGTLGLSSDGRFKIEFKATDDSWENYRIGVTVVDATGESLVFNTSMRSGSSINLGASLLDAATGSWSGPDSRGGILKDGLAKVKVSACGEKKHPNLRISYVLSGSGKALKTGLVGSGETLSFDLSGEPSGLYVLDLKATARSEGGSTYEDSESLSFVKAGDSDSSLNMDAEDFFKKIEDGDIAIQVGTTTGSTWVVAELYGEGNVLLEHRMVRLDGQKGKDGSLKVVRYPWKSSYGEAVTLNLLYFRNGKKYSYSSSFSNDRARYVLPLSFTRFEDRTRPSREYSFTIKTSAEVECAATIFDVSTEKISPNVWRTVPTASRPLPGVGYSTMCGCDSSFGGFYAMPVAMMSKATAYGARMGAVLESNAIALDVVEDSALAMAEETADAAPEAAAGEDGEVAVRSDFQNTLAWEPHLLSDANGDISLNFSTSDKLSTYYVQLFAHDKAFNNSTLRREMTVSVPVKAAIVEPQFLYEGDRYVAKATVSSTVDRTVSGKVTVSFLNGDDYRNAAVIGSTTQAVTVPAGGSLGVESEIAVPHVGTLGILVRFDSDSDAYGSDAVFVSVPVSPAMQTIKEVHSALLRYGDDRDALEASLRAMFTNVDGSKAALREISIIDMIREALPEKSVPHSDNVLEQSDALWANSLIRSLSGRSATNEEQTAMIKKIAACQNSDGGYGWFAGMRSTAIVTAVILERFAEMGEDCPYALREQVPAAVRFLDKTYLSDEAQPYWMGWVNLGQYLHVRAMYPEISLNTEGVSGKRLSEFRKEAREYLTPKKARGLNGQIFEKARRLSTLQLLSEGGSSLARSFGIRFGVGKKIQKSMEADVESLLQYAVEHRSGGIYYPNAVMPWRGLLEGELYAHNLLARLMTDFGHDDVAEGIRLWMMVQKETQQWSDDHAYIEAIATVLDGKEETLQTKVLALSAEAQLPFSEIKAAGNGFTIGRSYTVVRTVEGRSVEENLADGQELNVGDRVIAHYKIWNEENRSFVKVNAPRCAAFRPVQQLSGWYRSGYRNVLSDRTEYWFDSYPEENTEITEDFLVTQAGTFQSPVVTVESLYATHYRANDACAPKMTAR